MARILSVDDDVGCAVLMQMIVQGQGHAADCAYSGSQAVEWVRAVDYDLVIMDLEMPGMDGIETLGIIRLIPGRLHLPAIMCSAVQDPRRVTRCLAAGFLEIIHKPCRVEHIEATVARVLADTQGWREI